MCSPSARICVVLMAVTGCEFGASSPRDAGVTAIDAGVCLVASADARTSCDGVAGCDYFLHCGCSTTDKCSVGTSGSECGPAGSGRAGTSCVTDGDCARGTVCAPFFGVTQCLQFCDLAHACSTGQACYVIVNDRQGRAVGQVCGPTCSLVDQTCANAGLGCFVSTDHCVPDEGLCLTPGSGTQGSSCSRMGDCQKGTLCIDPGGPPAPICAKICDRKDGVPSCDVGTTCHELPGHTQTGICLP